VVTVVNVTKMKSGHRDENRCYKKNINRNGLCVLDGHLVSFTALPPNMTSSSSDMSMRE
jgi:hypothetical protein